MDQKDNDFGKSRRRGESNRGSKPSDVEDSVHQRDSEHRVLTFLRLGRSTGVHQAWVALAFVLILVSAAGLVTDVKNTAKYGQIDLRNRVVGARLMLISGNPYTYQWQPGESELLLDPLSPPGSRITKTTATPTALAVHAPFSGLGYREQKFLWLGVQWLCLVGTVMWALSLTKDPVIRGTVVVLALAFSCSAFWREHIEVGQITIFYGFVATLFIAGLRRRGWAAEIINGAVLGLLVCLRPECVFLGLPLLVYRRGRQVLGSVVGIALGLAIPSAFSPKVWLQYVGMIRVYLQPPAHIDVSPPAGTVYPTQIEGLTNITNHAPYSDLDSCVAGVLQLFGRHTSAQVYLMLILLAVAWWCVRIFRGKQSGAPIEFATASTYGLVLLTTLLLPIRRLPYSDAILVPVVLLLIATGGRPVFQSTRNLVLIFLAVIFGLEIRWFFLGGLVPCLAVTAFALVVAWTNESQAPASPPGSPGR